MGIRGRLRSMEKQWTEEAFENAERLANEHRPLTREQEQTATPQELARCCYKLAIDLAYKWTDKTGLKQQEALDVATDALIKASNSFDPSKGCRMNTWAYWVIRSRLYNAVKIAMRRVQTTSLDEPVPNQKSRLQATKVELVQCNRTEAHRKATDAAQQLEDLLDHVGATQEDRQLLGLLKDGYQAKEIASLMGIPTHKVRADYSYIKSRIRKAKRMNEILGGEIQPNKEQINKATAKHSKQENTK